MIITFHCGKNDYDIMTNQNNVIRDTLEILQDKGMLFFEDSMPQQIYSVRKRKNISVDSTYKKGGVYQGDILKIRE